MSITGRNAQAAYTEAIERCLAGCYRDDSPMLRLSECLRELRACGWSEEHIRQVELLVLKRLVGLQANSRRAFRPSLDDTVID